AERTFWTAIKLSRMDLFDPYAAQVTAFAAQAQAGEISREELHARRAGAWGGMLAQMNELQDATKARAKAPDTRALELARVRGETEFYCKTWGDMVSRLPIAAKLPVNAQAASVIQMASNDKVSDSERKELEFLIQTNSNCLERKAVAYRDYPVVAPFFATLKAAHEFAWADLLGGKTSYGDANRRIKEAFLRYDEQVLAMQQRQKEMALAQQAEKDRSERESWAAFGSALQGLGAGLNAASAPPPPAFSTMPSTRIETCRFHAAGPNAIRRECY
ncbi:MAG: hypothetical protein V4601_05445, partial [Pseudomonadota bacterium]